MKKVIVEPPHTGPYLISVCLERSSAFSIGDDILSTVKKAARLAVYDEIMMRVKNHQMPLTIRVEMARGATSEPEMSGKEDNIIKYAIVSKRSLFWSGFVSIVHSNG